MMRASETQPPIQSRVALDPAGRLRNRGFMRDAFVAISSEGEPP